MPERVSETKEETFWLKKVWATDISRVQ
jgi:hypothetical protein